MDPAYKLMLFGVGLGIFYTIIGIIKWKIIDPREAKKNKTDQDSLVKG
ncbi:MAG: hypothetical protein LBO66_12275 [Deltaproteobacteria bacterium]|jgi:hypothetical protein|nr:hypothetical protein [Deltaproteobacteria bacterium]